MERTHGNKIPLMQHITIAIGTATTAKTGKRLEGKGLMWITMELITAIILFLGSDIHSKN